MKTRTRIRCIKTTIKAIDTRTVKPMKKTADPFYKSAAWRNLMEEIYQERGRRCEECGRTSTRLHGDHQHELRDGGAPLDKSNIKVLCGSCHQIKSARARAARMAERFT